MPCSTFAGGFSVGRWKDLIFCLFWLKSLSLLFSLLVCFNEGIYFFLNILLQFFFILPYSPWWTLLIIHPSYHLHEVKDVTIFFYEESFVAQLDQYRITKLTNRITKLTNLTIQDLFTIKPQNYQYQYKNL